MYIVIYYVEYIEYVYIYILCIYITGELKKRQGLAFFSSNSTFLNDSQMCSGVWFLILEQVV